MDQVSIFISHSTKYADIARSLKQSLLQVSSRKKLEISLSEDMPAGRQWRKWIDDNVRTANVFVLLYPHPDMDMAWCNYELGRFYQIDDNVVCIRNTDILKPPPAFEPYQSIQADEAGIMKFLNDLFVTGVLTKQEILNEDVGKVSSGEGVLANRIAHELAEKFAEARVDEQLYERRLVISVKYSDSGKLNAEESIVEGNENGLNLIGYHHTPNMRWSDVRTALAASAEWPVELERAMPAMASGQLPPSLSPFRSPAGIFIPVIVKAELVDRELRQVFVIFVPADSERLGALFEGSSLPKGMPTNLKSLVLLLRLMFRARWEVLEPYRAEASYRRPSKERCAEIVGLLLAGFKELSGNLADLDLGSSDAFHEIFDDALWNEINDCISEWLEIVDKLKAKSPDNAEELARFLAELRSNNAKWMNVGATQFAKAIGRYCEPEASARPASAP